MNKFALLRYLELRIFGVIIVALLLIPVEVASAQSLLVQQDQIGINPNAIQQDIRRSPQANATITERQAVSLARQRFPGNILRITLIGEGANRRYQIRMENEGKVFTVFVNVATGRVTGGG